MPANLRVKKITEVDYIEYLIFSGKAKTKTSGEHLEVWFGGHAATTDPPQKLLPSSANSRPRSWSCEKVSGSDVRGELADGTHWHWIGLPLGVASYRTKSQELADAFDRVIESFCCSLEMLSK